LKKSQATFKLIVESLCVNPVYAVSAKAAGISVSSLWSFLASSARRESGYTLDSFMGETDVPLHIAAKAATRVHAASVIQALEARAAQGDWIETTFRGQRVFELNPLYLDWSNEDFAAMGIDIAQRYLRDENNLPIRVKVWNPPPEKLALAVAAAHYERLYGQRRSLSIDQRVSLGVHTVPSQPKPLPAPVAVQVIAPPADRRDDDLNDLLDPVAEDDRIDAEVVDAPTEQMVSEPPPAADRYGELQRQLLARALKAGTKVV
jgi:hypothetical protein